MPNIKLTALAVEKIRPPETGRIEYFDTAFPAFGLRVSDRGTKAWILFYRYAGRQRRMTLGRFPALSLADARESARTAIKKVEMGIDPAEAKRRHKTGQFTTVADVADQFVERYAKRKTRRWQETERILNKEVLSRWGGRPVTSITSRDIRDLLEDIVDRGAPVMAKQTLAAVRKCFNWAVEQEYLDSSPAAGIKSPVKVPERDRVLDDSEIKVVWAAFDQMGYPFSPLFKLLLLTGQRLNEVATIRWSDFDLETKTWTLPAEKTKAGRAHQVPLSDFSVEVLKSIPRLSGEYVFSGTKGDRPVSGFSAGKRRVDRLCQIDSWRIHDLRRTAASGMARSGTAMDIISRVLNHSDARVLGGVTAIYNRYAYEDEKREALDAWAEHLREQIEA